MPLGNKKRYPNTVARRKISGVGAEANRPKQTPITITNTVPGASTVLTLDTALISLKGIPQFESQTGLLPTAAEVTGPGEITLTYVGTTPTSIIVPFEDPAIRSTGGGYVSPGTFS